MSNEIESIENDLKLFKLERDVGPLKLAVNLVNSLAEDSTLSPDAIQVNHIKLLQFLKILNAIDTLLDRDFDFKDVPLLTVAPPPGVPLPAGVDPAAISDPKIRKQYEDAIEKNRAKAAEHSFQKKLHRVNGMFLDQTNTFIVRTFPLETAPHVLEIINKEVNLPVRKNELRRTCPLFKPPI